MRFAAASKNNAGNYAAAGAQIINASTDIQQAIANRKPNYTGIAIAAMDAASLEKQAALKAETQVNTAGLKAVADVKQAELTADSHVAATQSTADARINVAEMEANVQELKDKRRMAGKLSALGALAAKAAIKPKKVDRPEIITTDRSGQISKAQSDLDEATAKYNQYYKNSGEQGEVETTPTAPTTGSTPAVSTSLTPGSDGLYTVGIVELGERLRDNFGLTIVEHPAFGGVTNVHAPNSHHYYGQDDGTGEAIDVQDHRSDVINGVHWTDRTANLRDLLKGSGHEVLGPGDPGHSTHLHLGNHGGIFSLNQQQYDYLFGGNSGGKNATFVLNNS